MNVKGLFSENVRVEETKGLRSKRRVFAYFLR